MTSGTSESKDGRGLSESMFFMCFASACEVPGHL